MAVTDKQVAWLAKKLKELTGEDTLLVDDQGRRMICWDLANEAMAKAAKQFYAKERAVAEWIDLGGEAG